VAIHLGGPCLVSLCDGCYGRSIELSDGELSLVGLGVLFQNKDAFEVMEP
jgi:hypothetical protein